jgi:hypothetical protein
MQLFGLATRPHSRPTNNIIPKPANINAIRTGFFMYNAPDPASDIILKNIVKIVT